MQLTARIRAICIVFALFLVPNIVHATDYYLVGDFNKWATSDTYKFTVSGTTATLSLTGAQINSASTEFLIQAVESSSNSWYLKNSSATTVTVDGAAVTASSAYNNYDKCNYKVSGLSTVSTTTYTFTLTADDKDINSSKLKITSSTTSSGGGGSSTTTTAADGYYLLTDFIYASSGGDTDGTINKARRIFKFKQTTTGYSIDIPATLTGKAQILGVSGTTETIYGPGKDYGIHGNDQGTTSAWPKTNGSVSGDLSANNSYNWKFTSRNYEGGENTTNNDDGMYTISFTVNTDGTPNAWTITHNAYKRVVYVVKSDMSEPAYPLYNARGSESLTSGYSDVHVGSVYLANGSTYYVLSNIVLQNDMSSYATITTSLGTYNAYPTSSGVIRPTAQKLLLLGNGGNTWEQSDNHNRVYANYNSFNVSVTSGTYILQFNPSTADNSTTKSNNGVSGELWIYNKSLTVSSVTMVGTAVAGTTTTGDDGTVTWNYTDEDSPGNMTYDEKEQCYKLTLTTSATDDYSTLFRFVANHSKQTTWDEGSTTATDIAYNTNNTSGHKANVEDPNAVTWESITETAEPNTDYNIIFNRTAGLWTVKFYIEANKSVGGTVTYNYYYTIQGVSGISITPGTSSIAYGKTVTPKVTVGNPDSESTLYYIYTIGKSPSNPTIDSDNSNVKSYSSSDGNASLSTLSYDKTNNQVSDGTNTYSGNSVTIKAYAVKKRSDGTYSISGDMASVTYTFLTFLSGTGITMYYNSTDKCLYRTFSYPKAMSLPTGLKAYIAYKYEDGTTTTSTNTTAQGAVHLREIKYIPANVGVVLKGTYKSTMRISTSDHETVKDAYNLTEYTGSGTIASTDSASTLYTTTHSDWHNMLKGYNEKTSLSNNVFVDANNNITYRLFAFNFYCDTKSGKAAGITATNETDNYAGFFRFYPTGSHVNANNAILLIPAATSSYGNMTYNGQRLGNNFTEADTDVTTTSSAKTFLLFDECDDVIAGNTTGITEYKSDADNNDGNYYNLQGMKVTNPHNGIFIHNGKKVIIK